MPILSQAAVYSAELCLLTAQALESERNENSMDSVPLGIQRREAAQSTKKVGLIAANVEAAIASREEAARLRRRLLKMIVDNEQQRRSTTVTNQV
jgi:hypothetical protein